jgi:hypothetical protein
MVISKEEIKKKSIQILKNLDDFIGFFLEICLFF